jgi:RNA polymerase primary sigma factor
MWHGDNSRKTTLLRWPPLSREEEHELFVKIKAGDMCAREKVLRHNLRFVARIAHQYASNSRDRSYDDMFAEGVVGLTIAVDRFDGTKGVKFISYAIWWIRQCISRMIADDTTIRIPANKTLANNKYRRLNRVAISRSELPENIPDIPTIIRLETQTENGESAYSDEVANMMDEDDTLHYMNSKMIQESQCKIIDRLTRKLPERNRQIIQEYFNLEDGEPKTLQDIADRFKLSRERVRQIKEQSIRIMLKSAKKDTTIVKLFHETIERK